jgi:hypothetical protein
LGKLLRQPNFTGVQNLFRIFLPSDLPNHLSSV